MNCPSCGHDNRAGRKYCVSCGAALPRPCPACGADCEAGENFCGECGEPLAAASPVRTRTDTPTSSTGGARAPTGRASGDAGARKVVTIVFADLAGSTALHERVDAESAHRLMERYYLALRRAVESHGGTVVKLLGDGVMAAFGLHHVTEDDALRAVRGAAAMQDAFRALVRAEGEALGAVGLRVAVNTGEVVVAAGEDDVVGDPVNVAARLQEQGRDGDVVLGEATRRLVSTRVTLEPLGSVSLKGRAEAVAAHRLVSLDPPAGAIAAPFVGRDAELARLEGVFDTAVTTPATRLAVLVGSPGLGKSRLIEELSRRHADDATILAAHCDAAGGATFAPLAQALRGLLGLTDGVAGQPLRDAVEAALAGGSDDAERTRIAAGIDGLLGGAATSPEETFFVVRRFLAALAAGKPVVLVIDDLHWAEPLLLDLVEHLVQWGSGVPLFVLVGARPELRELRSSLVTPGGVVAHVVTLGGLDAGAAMRLAASVIGATDLPAAVAAKVLATSEGNPLFVGELVRMLVQEGALARDGDRWTAGAALAALEMPPTIHALLAARIERLRPEERTVLERAAVVGRHFSRSALAALLGRPGDADSGELDARLESLRRSELIERDSGWFLGEPALRFHHALIRDAAYRRLLKGTRAELHSQLADWIEGRFGDAPEHDETIGRHLEQAHQLLLELGPSDAAATALGERAARRLAAAGRRALARDDVSLAAALLGRALALLGPQARERADLLLDRCEALLTAGDVAAAADAIAELDRMATQASAAAQTGAGDEVAGETAGNADATGTDGDDKPGGAAHPGTTAAAAEPASDDERRAARRLRAWHTCFAGQLTVLTAPAALHATAAQVGAAAEELARLEDAAGEAKAHSVHAQALARLGRIGAGEAALDLALAAARRAGDRRRANAVLAGAPLAALWGPSPVTRASGRCLDVVRVLRITQGAPAVEAVALSCQGVLEALRGRIDAARRMLASSRTMVEELGIAHRLHETDVFAGRIDLLEGDAPAAERTLRSGYEGLRDLGLGIDAARAAALLGRALLAQDRAAEAEALSQESEMLAGDDLQAAIAWRGVRAEALARRGDHAAAIALAEAAVAIAEATDALLDHADARLALAAALRAGGRLDEADAEERRAVDLWEAKGATVLAGRARRSEPEPVTSEAGPSEPACEAEAPLEECPADPAMQPLIRRPATPNAATATLRRFREAEAARDLEALQRAMSPDIEVVHHTTGTTYGLKGMVATWRSMFRATKMDRRQEEIATLGNDLAVGRHTIALEGFAENHLSAFGSVEINEVVLTEADAAGRIRRFELFSSDRLGAALIRMYELHAEGQDDADAARRARGIARALAVTEGPIDIDGIGATTSESVEVVDHRLLGVWPARNREEWLRHWRAHFGLADDSGGRYDEVLTLAPDAILVHQTLFGTDRTSGGKFEFVLLNLYVFDDEGFTVRLEIFDPGDTAAALARFDELVGSTAGHDQHGDAAPSFANAASRADTRLFQSFHSRDWADIEALAAPDLVFDERRRLTRNTCGREVWLEQFRVLFDVPASVFTSVLRATRGERLALNLHRFEGQAAYGGGPLEMEDHLALHEVDADGRIRRIVLFDLEDEEAAHAELDALWQAGSEAARCPVAARHVASTYDAIEARDWKRYTGHFAPTVNVRDRRLVGFGSFQGSDQLVAALRLLSDLAPDVATRIVHVRTSRQAIVSEVFRAGTRDGGAFENSFLMVTELDAAGLGRRLEVYEVHQVDNALARFAEITTDEEPFANAATRAVARIARTTDARDWEGLADTISAGLDFDDRRALLRMRLGREEFLQQHRVLFDAPNARWSMTTIATRGERLSLSRLLFLANAAEGGGDLEIDHLSVIETDDDGRMRTIVLFEAGDLDTAHAELESRWQAQCEVAHGSHAWHLDSSASAALAARDWDSLATMFSPTLAARDHRLVGWGELQGPEAFVTTMRAMVDLASDAQTRAVHLRTSKRGNFAEILWTGTHDGGVFESSFLWVVEFDPDGLAQQLDFYDLRHFDRARSRFAEIDGAALAPAAVSTAAGDPSPPDSIAALLKPNLAIAGMEHWSAAYDTGFDTGNWDAVCATLAPGFVFDDRRRLVLIRGDSELMIASLREHAANQASFDWKAIGGFGDRVAVGRTLWSGGPPDGRFEIEYLSVIEVDEDGRPVAFVLFDVVDATAAQREAFARWGTIEPEKASLANVREITDAWNGKKLEILRARFAEDMVANDRRRTGFGRLEGRDAYLRSVTALWELAPQSRLELGWIWFVSAPHGGVLAGERSGTVLDGGELASDFLVVLLLADGIARFLEVYEVDDLEAALARFEELSVGRGAS
ncbi:MAG: AAA family ATPase [Candidatus Binatia bacterium]